MPPRTTIIGRALRAIALAAGGRICGRAVEESLVAYFKNSPSKKALLDRVHARVCRRQRKKQRTDATAAHLAAVHEPLTVLQLMLDMGATKTGYRHLIAF